MSLSPRRLLRPWRQKSFGSSMLSADAETISAVDYYGGGQRSKQSHDSIVVTQSKQLQLGELQEELKSLGSILTDASREPSSRREQAEAVSEQYFQRPIKKVKKQRQTFVSQQLDQEANAQESRDDESSNPHVHEIQYTYRAGNRPMEDRNIKELFKDAPPDGQNLRTVQELLEGSDTLPPWLRDMLVKASVKVKQIPFTPNDAHVSKHARAKNSFLPFFRCESDADSGIGASLSEAEGTTVMSSFSELSEPMEDSENLCSLFTIYF
jgi:hypothetical protein